MQVYFTAEQEEHLARVAGHHGKEPEHLVREAALRLLEEETRFRTGVERGLAAAQRGEFIEHEQVWTGVEAILNS